jgi:hypothetical protein
VDRAELVMTDAEFDDQHFELIKEISFFIHPVNATISGNVEGATGKVNK